MQYFLHLIFVWNIFALTFKKKKERGPFVPVDIGMVFIWLHTFGMDVSWHDFTTCIVWILFLFHILHCGKVKGQVHPNVVPFPIMQCGQSILLCIFVKWVMCLVTEYHSHYLTGLVHDGMAPKMICVLVCLRQEEKEWQHQQT